MLFISKQDALAAGMTHHGSIYGLPAWVRETEYGVDGAPKFIPAAAWCWAVDWLYDTATWFMPADRYIEAPLRVGRPIEDDEQ